MKLLVAEDEPTYNALLQAVLSASGYDVVSVRDGSEACDVLNGKDPPQLAILDWSMPRMDGVDICRKARKNTDRKFTYFILLTGRDSEDDLVHATEAGADDFFTKNSNLTELLLRVNTGRRIVELQNQIDAARDTAAGQAAEIENATTALQKESWEVPATVLAAMNSIASHAKKLEEICSTEQCRFYSRDIYKLTRAVERSLSMIHPEIGQKDK